jgi:CheY-like chemotaxis protein
MPSCFTGLKLFRRYADIFLGRMMLMQQKLIAALVLSTDIPASPMLGRIFAECHIVPETRTTSRSAQEALRQTDFDLLLVDFDEPEALSLLEAWNRRDPNTSKAVIAVSSRPELLTLAQLYQAKMVLQKPLYRPLVEKTVKLATEILMRKRRASYRHSVNIKCSGTAQDSISKWTLENIALLDISQNGLCLKAPSTMTPTTKVELTFVLPETSDRIHVAGLIVRSEPNGVAGVYFHPTSEKYGRMLKTWLDARDPTLDTISQVDNPSHLGERYHAATHTSY